MNWICCNCKLITKSKQAYCSNCNGKIFEQTLAKPTPSAKTVPVKAISIKDKISPGEWRSAGPYIRTQDDNIGMGWQIGSADNVYSKNLDGEPEANAKLWAASKRMLDTIERLIKEFDSADNHGHQRGAIENAKELISHLNN